MHRFRNAVAILLLGFASTATASTLTFVVPAHDVVTFHAGERRPLRVLLASEGIEASVTVDVYSMATAPGSERHIKELRAMPSHTWWRDIAWSVVNSGGQVQRVTPRLLANRVRTNPSEVKKWREAPSHLKRYDASFDLGTLPAGDYTLQVSVRGLTSAKVPLAIRTGDEPEVREYAKEWRRKRR